MKIGVLGKSHKVKDENVIDEIIRLLENAGHSATRILLASEINGLDVLIVLGGDGAILHSAVSAAQNNVKIIGINYGNLGFLTEYEKDERLQIVDLITQLENNECRILKRSLLQLEVGDKIFYALNEVSLQRDYLPQGIKNPQILRLEVQSNEGKDVIAGDGLLICTPTGSTAYSLSAGGAILTPEVPVFMLTPICAFSMRSRPTVFSDNEEFSVKIQRGKALLLTDGLAVAGLPENSVVKIKKAPFTADFPIRENSDFFSKVRNKLNE